jgi:catechol 2,3-dioxygenase-like lactoylglutathione lyase family enzyme
MSIRQIDHIVIAVRDLDQAITDYQHLGFTVFPGGEHPGGYTHNALVIFADGSYFELIAFKQARPGWRWWELLQRHGEGIIDYALLPGDVDLDVAAIQARGLELEGPLDGGRTRLDGQQLFWKTARGLTEDVPFLCGDLTPRELRVPTGDVRKHANGVRGIASLTIAVRDIATSSMRYQALLDCAPSVQTTIAGLGVSIAVFPLGNAQLILVAPQAEQQPSAVHNGIRSHLGSRGEGLMALALLAEQPGELLNLKLTHQASIELVRG